MQDDLSDFMALELGCLAALFIAAGLLLGVGLGVGLVLLVLWLR